MSIRLLMAAVALGLLALGVLDAPRAASGRRGRVGPPSARNDAARRNCGGSVAAGALTPARDNGDGLDPPPGIGYPLDPQPRRTP